MKTKYSLLFKNPNFLKLFSADMINRFGDSIDAIALTWVVYYITGSASWSALVFTVNRLPSIFIQPIAGAYVEKRNKRLIMVISDFIRALLVGYIATKLVMDLLTRWDILIVMILISTVEAFRQPTSGAFIPEILSNDELELGIALENSASRLIELLGLSLAGVIIAAFGNAFAIYLDMTTFLLSGLILLAIRLPKAVKQSTTVKQNLLADFKDGLKVVVSSPQLMSIIFLAIFLNGLLTPFNSLQAPLISEVLHGNEIMLSIISAGITGGMIVGSLLYPRIKERVKPKSLVMISSYFMAIAFIGPCLVGQYVNSLILSEILIAVIFLSFGILVAMLNLYTGVQVIRLCDHQYLARVSGLMVALALCVTPVISFLLSLITNYVSTYQIFMATGILCILVTALVISRKEYL